MRCSIRFPVIKGTKSMTMSPSSRLARAFVLAGSLASLAAPLAFAPGVAAAASDAARKAYSVPAGQLSHVLAQFAAQAGVPLSFDPAALSGLSSPGLQGSYTVREGFDRLLAGSGYEPLDTGGGRYVLRRVPAPGEAVTLAPVAVVASGAVESAVGPVQGYAARRSATATRTDAALRDIPQAIQVVPTQVVEDQRALSLEDAVRNVSGVYRENTFGNTLDRFTLRGFTQTDFLRDGYRDGTSGMRGLSGVERVEVLKGPASVLYGSLDPGGVINVVTKRPPPTEVRELSLQGGSHDFYRADVDVGGPLGDGSVGYRVSGLYQDAGTFRKPADVGAERVEFIPSLSWQIGERTHLWAQFNYLRSKVLFDRGLIALGDAVAPIPNSRFLGEPGDHLTNEQYGLTMELTHEFNDYLSLRQGLRASWFNSHDYRAEVVGATADGTLGRRFSMNEDDGYQHSWQIDLIGRFRTGAVKHEVLFGVDLSRQNRAGINGSNPTLVPISIYDPVYGAEPLPITTLARDDDNTTDTIGVYLQDQVALSDSFKLLAGVRYDRSRYTGRDYLRGQERRQSDSAFSPRFGAVWQPTRALSLYASYSEGFRPNTAGNLADGSPPKPTRSRQYEVGMKGEWLDGKLTSTLALFHLTKHDITTMDPNDSNFVVQTGKVRSRGVEFDLSGEPLPGWSLMAAYAYIDAAVIEDNSTPVGNRLASVPRHGASLWSVYRFRSGALDGFGIGAGVYYVGERQGDLANSFTLPAYTRVDATVFYEAERWRAALNVKNLFDRNYYASSSSRSRIDPGMPLTVIGTLTLRF